VLVPPPPPPDDYPKETRDLAGLRAYWHRDLNSRLDDYRRDTFPEWVTAGVDVARLETAVAGFLKYGPPIHSRAHDSLLPVMLRLGRVLADLKARAKQHKVHGDRIAEIEYQAVLLSDELNVPLKRVPSRRGAPSKELEGQSMVEIAEILAPLPDPIKRLHELRINCLGLDSIRKVADLKRALRKWKAAAKAAD
jgi:hypothetical protein